MPVFGLLEEAETYGRLQPRIQDWEPRGFSPGEIVSVLCGPLSSAARVALDPLPEACDKTLLDLLCVRRNAFVGALVGGGRNFAPATSQKPLRASPDSPSSRS